MSETLFGAIGGVGGCRRLAESFYARVDGDPLLRPLFPGKTLHCAIEELAAFLIQFLGGPAEASQRRWWVSLRESHARFRIGSDHRKAWMSLMVRALDDAGIGEPARTALRRFFEESSAYVVNQGERPRVPKASHELADRWQRQLELDEAVAAIRAGDADRALALAESSPREPGGLLAIMIGSGHPRLLQYVRERVMANPSLLHERYASRTLLHVSAARGATHMVELLLQLGADPNVRDGGGHTPLYSLSNECSVHGAGDIVRLLVAGGANVDADDGVKRCTPLHMAARRGNTEIAGALLDCGAGMETQDSLGHTPLRRAANCNKTDVAALLVSRGANRHSRCKRGLTPLLAARSEAMKQLFERTPGRSPAAGQKA